MKYNEELTCNDKIENECLPEQAILLFAFSQNVYGEAVLPDIRFLKRLFLKVSNKFYNKNLF